MDQEDDRLFRIAAGKALAPQIELHGPFLGPMILGDDAGHPLGGLRTVGQSGAGGGQRGAGDEIAACRVFGKLGHRGILLCP